jgi:hypothetical protein
MLTCDEVHDIAVEIIDMLRPKRLTVFDIRRVLQEINEGLDYVVLGKLEAE